MSTSRDPIELVYAVDEEPPDDLDQGLKGNWGVLMGQVRQTYQEEMNLIGQEVPEEHRNWLTGFCQVALNAAIEDPKGFCLFCEFYLRGPGGHWAAPSEDVEPISRPDTEADLWELSQTLAAMDLESKQAVYLWIMSLLTENRLKPMLLALPFLVRMVRDGGQEATREEMQEKVWKTFFVKDEEEWGTDTVETEQWRTLGEAYSLMSDSIEMAQNRGILPDETTERLEGWMESLSHDEIPPDQRGEGDTGRYGLVHLRNHGLHGNYSRRGDGSVVIGYAGLLRRSMEEKDLVAPTMMEAEQVQGNLSKLFGLTALHTAWECGLRNLYAWLDTWAYNEYAE